MRIIPRFGILLHLLRAGLVSGFALLILGTLMMASEYQNRRHAAADPVQVDGANAADGVDGVEGAAASDSSTAQRLRRQAFQMSVLGAIVGVFTALLLILFPVGPVTKVVFGIVCGPVLPILLFVPVTASIDDAGGMVLLGAVIGLLVGLLEASRITRNRRPAPQAEL